MRPIDVDNFIQQTRLQSMSIGSMQGERDFLYKKEQPPCGRPCDQYCENIWGMLASKSFFNVRFGVATLPSLLPYR